ncbi:MAG: hypothetical protein ING84_17970 [Cytophagales bacterium]|jgi:hypothetical protein|nr:hypothetical protein [Cytophagales bacterium]MCA6366963.1 hypothetical protein [Cytophagales bacterium]MCA6373693.1 hypothetical protein [Cytophagales bacterium]MCA6383090.1 hypothetical protein [Cytophagales bacterium]
MSAIEEQIKSINKWAGAALILLSILVAIPLTIKTVITNGGTWGFGIIGLAILLPLDAYVIFGVAGLLNSQDKQQLLFRIGHLLSVSIGVIGLVIFPLFPFAVAIVPVALSLFSFLDRKHFQYYLLLMVLLALTANCLLLKWELDFGRAIPFFQLFQTDGSMP